jgi:hypothetical protein
MLEDCDCEYSQVDEIAESIYESEFYDFFDSGVAEDVPKIKTFKARISAWIETNIGQLNILIHSSHRITKKNDICPRLRPEEISILIQLYLREFYKRESRLALKGVSSSSSTTTTGESSVTMTDWVELREGDSSIKRQSLITTPQQKIQAAQTYKSISKEADLRIKDMVQYYNLYNSLPRQVVSQGIKTTSCDKKPKDCKEELVDCPEKAATLTPTPPCNEPTSTLTATETQTSTVTPTITKTTTTTSTLTHTSTPTVTSTSTTTETPDVPTPTSTLTATSTSTTTETPDVPTPTSTLTATSTSTTTLTHTSTSTLTHTSTSTLTHTSTPTVTHTSTSTVTHTSTPTLTHTSTSTVTHTSTATETPDVPTPTPTSTLTATSTSTTTLTHTSTSTLTHTSTPTLTHTSTSTLTHTSTPTLTHTSTSTLTHTSTPTLTHTSTSTLTHTSTPTLTHTSTTTLTHTSTSTLTHTSTPTLTHTSTTTLTHTSTNTLTHTSTPTLTHTSTSTLTHTSTPTPLECCIEGGEIFYANSTNGTKGSTLSYTSDALVGARICLGAPVGQKESNIELQINGVTALNITAFSNVLTTNKVYITKSIADILTFSAQPFTLESKASFFKSLQSFKDNSPSPQTTCGFGFCAEYAPCNPTQIDPTRCIDLLTCPENISGIENQFIGYADGDVALDTFMSDSRCYNLVNDSVPVSNCSAFVGDDIGCGGGGNKFQDVSQYNSWMIKKVPQTGSHVFESCAGCCHCDDDTTCVSATIEWNGTNGVCNFIINTAPTPTP